jgi:hypothetical protein
MGVVPKINRKDFAMFCSECGTRAHGKFCSACGNRLGPNSESTTDIILLPTDWSEITDYETLLGVPQVRDAISRAAAQSQKKMTGEEFLEMYFKALGKMAGLPVPIPVTGIARFAQSTYAKMGVKTGKEHAEFIRKPPGMVLVSILCSLARNGRTLRSAHQLTDGCLLVAALPSDLFALEGDLIITVTRVRGGTHVEAKTDIKGQLFDWGKSTRCLEALFAELIAPAVA